MSWFYLFTAGIFEIVWAIAIKYSHGFTKKLASFVTIVGIILSFYFLALSLKSLPLGTAYAIWTGIGTLGTVIFGSILFKESLNVRKIICIALIVTGIVGCKFLS